MSGGVVEAAVAGASQQMVMPLEWTRSWGLLAACSAGGVLVEHHKNWSASVVTMVSASALATLGLLPSSSPAYGVIMRRLAVVAVPLLLLDADFGKFRLEWRRLLKAYGIACAGTIIGTLIAWPVLYKLLPTFAVEDGAIVAAGLAARHIGGAVNFIQVCDAAGATANVVAAGIAADNAIVAPYFALLFRLGLTGENIRRRETATADEAISAIAIALACVAVAALVFPPNAILPGCTFTAICAASFFKKICRAAAPAGRVVGALLMQFFIAAVGASSGTLNAILDAGGPLFFFSVLQLALHFSILIGAHKLAEQQQWKNLDIRSLAVASNAAVGGPTTAAAMCVARGWNDLLLPGLVVGILGYASGTIVALGVLQLIYLTLPY